jgi:NitT/TauT family transport system permease protein/sulfonate transport system permease protein
MQAILHLAKIGQLWPDIQASLMRVLVGLIFAIVTAVPLAATFVRWRGLAAYVLPLVDMARPISVIAWIPLAIIWFGLGDASAWFIIFLGAFFPIFTNAYHGFLSVDLLHIRVASCFGVSRMQFLRDVMFPSALPSILTGIRIGLGVGWMCVIAAEMIAAQSGLGYMIQLARVLIETEKVMAGMVLIGLIGFAMNQAMHLVETILMPWRRQIS